MTEPQKDNEFKKDSSLVDIRRNTEIFHGDQNIYIVSKRIQNIAAAVFMVTAPIAETEELRANLRNRCLDALSSIFALIGVTGIEESHVRRIAAPILELGSLLNVSFWSGLISEMNMLILQKELAKIERDIHGLIQTYKNKYLVSSSIFKDVEDIEIQSQQINKGQIKRQNIKDSIKDRRASPRPSTSLSSGSLSDNRSERRQVIIKLLGERGNLNIKDFTTVIPAFSEKTIQRELLALVAEGVVKRQGERRWSTYSLAQ